MKRNAQNLKKYRETCREVIRRADNRCEVLIDGVESQGFTSQARCNVYIPEPTWTNFLHTRTRNGMTDEEVLDPINIIFGCASHHYFEEQSGIRVERAEEDTNEIRYVPDAE